jgi:uridine kinase
MKPYLIGIAGPSCAGKSYLSSALCEKLDAAAAILRLDSYYRDLAHLALDERAHCNFDAPQALDSSLLIEHVGRLAQGGAIEKPLYDFKTHARTGLTERVEPGRFIIVEGLFALYWEEIRAALATKVFVDLGEEICLARRIERDMRERGRTRESVLQQFHTTVQPMARQYLHPTRQYADVVLTGNDEIGNEVRLVLSHIQASRERDY